MRLASSDADVERRHHDIGDAEHDLLGRLRRFGLADAVLGGAEDRIDRRRRERAQALAALEPGQALDLEMLGRGDIGEASIRP